MHDARTIADNVERVERQILAACHKAGRNPNEVKLMAVSKTHPVEGLSAAYAAGLRLFGENRVQEFQLKSPQLRAHGLEVAGLAGDEARAVRVHLIGHLQTNKASKAAGIFTGIDTLDSFRLAKRLHEAACTLERQLPVLVEVKLSAEGTKTGLEPESPEFAELLEQLPDLRHLEMRGLMTVAPLDENQEVARACFRQLRELRDRLSTQHPRLNFHELSMGMSGDYEIAIEEGSTMVRVGTAIFGARPKPA